MIIIPLCIPQTRIANLDFHLALHFLSFLQHQLKTPLSISQTLMQLLPPLWPFEPWLLLPTWIKRNFINQELITNILKYHKKERGSTNQHTLPCLMLFILPPPHFCITVLFGLPWFTCSFFSLHNNHVQLSKANTNFPKIIIYIYIYTWK